MLGFELLSGFVAVADCGGFDRAAKQLNLTQSTVRQQIKRLGLETGRPLFRRTTRSVALTDEGEMLLCDARRPLQLEEAACQRLAAPRLSGTLIHFGGERGTGSTRTVAVNPAERMTSGGTSSI
jgi:DNA-binding transcriptional LysR family regulator